MNVPVEPSPELVPFAPAAVRRAEVFGAPVELVHVPARRGRYGGGSAARPAFVRSRAAAIVGAEATWRGDGLALTPNRFPFAAGHRLLWPEAPVREGDASFWRAVLAWVARSGGAALVNNVGAAATIGRAHAHLVGETLPFLAALPERTGPRDLIDLPPGVELVAKDVPCCLLGLRGEPTACAAALLTLAEARLTAAWNVVAQAGACWFLPRGAETPLPHFPYALGAAELWGRWCFMDEAPFAAATAADLERALLAAGTPPLG